MLTKIQNPKRAYAGRVLALPLLALIVVLFSFRNRISNEGVADSSVAGKSFVMKDATDTLPAKPGKAISSVDVKTKKEIKITYIDGSTETLTENEANARGLIHNGGYGNQPTAPAMPNIVVWGNDTAKKPPVIILNGSEISQAEMNAIDPNTIESIDVLKGESATSKYGKKAAAGVIIIRLKDGFTGGSTVIIRSDSITLEGDVTRFQIQKDGGIELEANELFYRKNPPQPGRGRDVIVIGKPMPAGPGKELVVVGKPLKSTQSGPVFTEVEEGASIDPAVWNRFLQGVLDKVLDDLKNTPSGDYGVDVRFIVNEEGKMSDFSAFNTPGKQVTEKLIIALHNSKSPVWKPAMQNGKKVKSYVVKRINLNITDQE